MSQTHWLPGILVLSAGLLLATLYLLFWRRPGSKGAAASEEALADADRRVEDLLGQLRELSTEAHQRGPAELQSEQARLEGLAAEAMRARDGLRASGRSRPTSPAPATSGGFLTLHPQLKGALWGAGLVAFFGALGFWLSQESKPRGAGEVATGSVPRMPAAGPEASPSDPAFDAAFAHARAQPGDLVNSDQVGHELIRRRSFDDAKLVTERSLGANPFDSEARIHRAFLRAVDGDPARAARELSHLADQYPNATEALLFLGMLHMQAGQNPEALAAFERFMRETPASEQPPQFREGVAMLRRKIQGGP